MRNFFFILFILDIYNNEISANKYGVVAFGRSETTIMGNESASDYSQQFLGNSIHCYFSCTSYPEDIRYNYFKKEHDPPPDDPYVKLVYWDLIEETPPVDVSIIYNIECNAWDSEFNGGQDLVPLGSYDYEPYWYPGQTCTTDWGEASDLFEEAKDFIDSTLYSQADSNFREMSRLDGTEG